MGVSPSPCVPADGLCNTALGSSQCGAAEAELLTLGMGQTGACWELLAEPGGGDREADGPQGYS